MTPGDTTTPQRHPQDSVRTGVDEVEERRCPQSCVIRHPSPTPTPRTISVVQRTRFDKRDVIILRVVAVSVAAADVGDELTIFDDRVIFYNKCFPFNLSRGLLFASRTITFFIYKAGLLALLLTPNPEDCTNELGCLGLLQRSKVHQTVGEERSLAILYRNNSVDINVTAMIVISKPTLMKTTKKMTKLTLKAKIMMKLIDQENEKMFHVTN